MYLNTRRRLCTCIERPVPRSSLSCHAARREMANLIEEQESNCQWLRLTGSNALRLSFGPLLAANAIRSCLCRGCHLHRTIFLWEADDPGRCPVSQIVFPKGRLGRPRRVLEASLKRSRPPLLKDFWSRVD